MELRAAIISTLAYFDIFDFPLTRTELWRWLYQGTGYRVEGRGSTIGEVDGLVSELVVVGTVKEENGFVFLSDRTGLPALRESRYRHAVRKWRRARHWAQVFSALPGVELVGIGNTLAYHNAKDGSDIDFFIVSEKGTIWRTRFFCAALAALFGLRPAVGANRDKLCLSFFVTSDALDLSQLKPDIYLTYWTAQMVPLAGTVEAMEKYCSANAWVSQTLSNGCRSFVPAGTKRLQMLKVFFWPLRFLSGAFLREWQTRKFPHALRVALTRNDGSVQVSDTMLKFHVNDRRREIENLWHTRLGAIPHNS